MTLERKFESALANRLKQNPLLNRIRIRHNSEESAKVNQDLVITAKRGPQNPPFSGIFEVEATITLLMGYRKTVDTLPSFLAILKAIEDVLTNNKVESTTFGVLIGELAAQLSLLTPDFHCYEVAISGKDDTPDTTNKKHSCIWSITGIAMSQSYLTASQLQTQN